MHKLAIGVGIVLLIAGVWSSQAKALPPTSSFQFEASQVLLEQVDCAEADALCEMGKMLSCEKGDPKPVCECAVCPKDPPQAGCACRRGTCCAPFGVGSFCCRN
jgi:hypothetical protein